MIVTFAVSLVDDRVLFDQLAQTGFRCRLCYGRVFAGGSV